MTADRRVVVTGLGALSALGDAEGLWAGLLAGRSGTRRIAHYDVAGMPCTVGGCVPEIDELSADQRDSALANLISGTVRSRIL
jgi:3-oxoacyl-(acyl-carrier-protein) synthase